MPKFKIYKEVTYEKTVEAASQAEAEAMAEELNPWNCDDEFIETEADQLREQTA
jgi:hypothetical protein